MATSARVQQAWLAKTLELINSSSDAKDMAYLGQVINDSVVSIGDDGQSIYDPNKPYGVIHDDNADTYLRINHGFFPIQSAFRRVVCDGNPMFGGTVFRYLDKDNSALFEDGTDATSYITGAEGGNYQVFVEIPKHYVKDYAVGNLQYNIIALTKFDGGGTESSFKKSGWADSGDGTDDAHEDSYAYISAFEGVRYDNATTALVNGTGLAPTLDTVNDKILSVAGYKPESSITRDESRKMVINGASKQFDWHRYSMMRRLFIIEYGTNDSQSMVPGYTEGVSSSANVVTTGLTISLGNNSGSINGKPSDNGGTGTTPTDAVSKVIANSYRGIENFFGHLWQWVDAVNISDWKPSVCEIYDTFADNVFETSPYLRAKDSSGNDITNSPLSGYQSTLNNGSFFPKSVGSDSDSKITDYYYQSSGSRVLRSGGSLYYSSRAGVSSLDGINDSSGVSWNLCCRA